MSPQCITCLTNVYNKELFVIIHQATLVRNCLQIIQFNSNEFKRIELPEYESEVKSNGLVRQLVS